MSDKSQHPKPDHSDTDLPKPKNEPDDDSVPQFITPIQTAEQQIGRHVIAALKHPDTVAVLTAAVMGPQGQTMVSVPLNQNLMRQVQELLGETEVDDTSEVRCVGFHCYLKNDQGQWQLKDRTPDADSSATNDQT